MEDNIKKTCLYDSHLALGAKMEPFAGFMMPIQYSSIIDEHNAVRQKAGMFDVSHMGEISVTGKDAEKFVNYIFTNDVAKIDAGGILYGMLLYPDGGTVDDLLVYKEDPESYFLVVNAANIDKDYDWIREQGLKFMNGQMNAAIVNESEKWGQIAVQGPDAESVLKYVLHLEQVSEMEFYTFKTVDFEGGKMIVSRTGYTGEDGFEIYTSPEAIRKIWKILLDAGVTPCGLGCRDTLRFEAGLPLYGHELSKDISPIEAGLGMFCKLEKEDFIGKEALLHQKNEGTTEKLVGIELQDKAVPRAGYPVELEDGTVIGSVTTGYHSISLGKSLCFALIQSQYSKSGTPLNIRIRKKVFSGIVVKKRFYQPNYKK